MKSPIFGKEKLLYFPQKSGIVPIFKKSPSSYISYFCHHAPWYTHIESMVILLFPTSISVCLTVSPNTTSASPTFYKILDGGPHFSGHHREGGRNFDKVLGECPGWGLTEQGPLLQLWAVPAEGRTKRRNVKIYQKSTRIKAATRSRNCWTSWTTAAVPSTSWTNNAGGSRSSCRPTWRTLRGLWSIRRSTVVWQRRRKSSTTTGDLYIL